MQRRSFLGAVATAAMGVPFTAIAQVTDLNDAINKAGRQRMLSQRMGKAWLALLMDVEPASARQILDRSISLFDRQLVELRTYAPAPDIRETYGTLDQAWNDYKVALVGVAPAKAGAPAVLRADAKVLALANQGTQQYEAVSGKSVGKLVNIAGRQRMLSQRMAKFYLAASLPVDTAAANEEIRRSRAEFVKAMEILRNAPEATPRIKEELQLADGQWVFFDAALNKIQSGANAKSAQDVFVSSENLLSVMDRVTGLYSAIKV